MIIYPRQIEYFLAKRVIIFFVLNQANLIVRLDPDGILYNG
jgi:hypothetical protein